MCEKGKETDQDEGKIAIFDMTHPIHVIQSYCENPSQCYTLNARMGTGGNQVPVLVYPIENHPADSRVTLNDPNTPIQTLTSRMGTGGGMFPSFWR